jgi:DNA-binding CsgD family transcriptional regulator
VEVGGGPDVLLERDVEVGLLVDLVRDAARGRGGLLLFTAPPGLGKSVLLDYGARVARDAGLLVLRARGHQLEQAFGWGVGRSLFEGHLLGCEAFERERLLDGPASPARQVFDSETLSGPMASDAGFAIMHGLYWLSLRLAQARPVLIVVDDAQWVDEPSLRFLIYLVGRVSAASVAVLVAARQHEPRAGGLMEVLAADGAWVHSLRPLGSASVGDLVQRRVKGADEAFRRRCFELTAGNPLQLRELLVALERAEQPADEATLLAGAAAAARSLERSVVRRLDAMSARARALAEAVAVFEVDVPLYLAAELAALEPADAVTAADELVREDLLRLEGTLGFVHPLLRAAVYGSLSQHARAASHGRAAKVLADAGAGNEQVCAHLLEAAPLGDVLVVERLRTAARRALAQGGPASAVDYLRRALREPPSTGSRSAVLAELGRAEATAGKPQAMAHLQAAIELAVGAEERARMLLDFGRVQHHAGQLEEACVSFRRGLDELTASGVTSNELTVELQGGYLNAAMFGSQHVDDAHRRAVDILAAADQLTTPAELALLSKAVTVRLWANGPRDEILTAARRLAREGPVGRADAPDSQAAWQVIATLGWADDYDTAADAIRKEIAEARRRGSVLAYAMACVLRSRHELWTGPIRDAVHDAREALEVLPDESVYVASAAYCLVSGLVEAGEPIEPAEVLARTEHQKSAPPFFAAWWQMARGRLSALRGDDEQALEAFLSAGRHHQHLRIVNPAVLPWRSEAGLVARRLGQPELARSLIEEELALAERFGAPRAVGVAQRAAGLLARGESSVELLRSAVDVLAGSGARVELARALADLGAATRRSRRVSEARSVLHHALELADSVGADEVASRARQELRLAGGRATQRPSAPADRLTPGERRVADLAAAGNSNRQIANALFITVKAVEWHLGNTYRKLQVQGRAELATALAGGTHPDRSAPARDR